MSGFVYAIGDETGRVKIGWSADPLKRLVKIKADCPSEAKLLGLVSASRKQEAEVHGLLERWRIRGEWFWREGAVEAFIKMLPCPGPRPTSRNPGENAHPLKRWRFHNKRTLESLAEEVGVTHASLSRLENNKMRPSLGLAVKLSHITNLAVDSFYLEAAE